MTSTNELSGAEAFVRMLQLHGVKYIFGLCGDTSLPFYDALYRLDHGITHILTRDERGPDARRHPLPAAARGARAGERMGGVSGRGR